MTQPCVACIVFTRENELSHYSVNFYLNIYIYCGTQRNNRSLDNTEDRSEFYPKGKCQNESNVDKDKACCRK